MENKIHAAVVQACRSFMVPIARFLLRNGFTYKEFAEVAKWAFVHVASEDYGLRGRKTSISRVSLITGISRKAIHQLRNLSRFDDHFKESHWSAPSQLLHVWYRDRRYLAEDGAPRALSSTIPDEFGELAKSINVDIPAGTILREMKRTGSIQIDDKGLVSPVARHYIPEPLSPSSINYMGAALSNLASTLNRNLAPNFSGSPFFERSAYTEALSLPGRIAVRKLVAEKGQRLLEQIDELISEHSDLQDSCKEMISGVGLYYFENSDVVWE